MFKVDQAVRAQDVTQDNQGGYSIEPGHVDRQTQKEIEEAINDPDSGAVVENGTYAGGVFNAFVTVDGQSYYVTMSGSASARKSSSKKKGA